MIVGDGKQKGKTKRPSRSVGHMYILVNSLSIGERDNRK